jgi:hypothetical protein
MRTTVPFLTSEVFLKVITVACLLLALLRVPLSAQTETKLLMPFDQMEFEPDKREKALTVTREYQAKERELKANTTLPGGERQKQITANYHAYLKKMEGLLNREQREKARMMLVENDIKGLRARPAMPRFFDQLGLNEEQIAKAKDLNLQQRIRTQTLYHTPGYTPEERGEENKSINQDFEKKFNEVLTPDQRTKWAELKKRWAVATNFPVPPLYQKLGLNVGQTEKLKMLLYERQMKMDAVNKNQSLGPEARQQQIAAINDEADKNAMALLNKEQRVRVDDLMREANYQMPPVFAQLGLDEAQQAKLKETLLWQGREIALLRQDAKLTTEQRQARLKEINMELQTRLLAFLTTQQQTRLVTLLSEMQQKAQTPKP